MPAKTPDAAPSLQKSPVSASPQGKPTACVTLRWMSCQRTTAVCFPLLGDQDLGLTPLLPASPGLCDFCFFCPAMRVSKNNLKGLKGGIQGGKKMIRGFFFRKVVRRCQACAWVLGRYAGGFLFASSMLAGSGSSATTSASPSVPPATPAFRWPDKNELKAAEAPSPFAQSSQPAAQGVKPLNISWAKETEETLS